ncbi:hypothetical protein VZT92_008987 [Zoarces viviparus]|uniref:Ig-like domain-containing protein n=2 Tax=Zoarces viviparus TaxID=48416 RepID=A0AAW1FH91_ZOAVI
MVRPSVSLLPPSSEQLSGGSATLTCLLSGYSPQGAVVSWQVDGTEVTEGVLSSSEEEKSGRYSSSSTLSLSRESWMGGELYSCGVLHHDHSQTQSLHRSQSGPMVRPSVSLLPPSSEQLSGGSATLTCLLSGYSPQGAVVSWQVDGTEVTEGVLSSSEEEKSGRYSSSSTLSLSRENWMEGELYSCGVLHHDHSQTQSLHRSQCEG